ncbi:hypothetical protein [Streptomyces sp. NPDC058657]|uniref:hypothetical protein n=1 Tax=unclassified Streptomyces TaxID=2593676 RepID=UPI003669EBFE
MSELRGVPPLPEGWPAARRLAVVPPQVPGGHRQEQRDERAEDWLDRLLADDEFGVQRPARAEVPVWELPPVDSIPDRDPSDDHLIDWDRVKSAVRAVHPVRALAVVGVGLLPAWVWAERVAEPMTREMSVDAAFAGGLVTAVIAGVGAVSGRGLRRWVCAALVVAVVGGTLIADPTRHLVSTWIVGV